MKIIFFDGVCGLCNGFVDFIIKIDKKQVFSFSPLQGAYASSNLASSMTQDLSSVVVLIDGKVYIKSEAVQKILTEIGGVWGLARLLILIPRSVQNYIYDQVAKNRYSLFGKKQSCRIPTEEERSRFVI
jgi:predicted DCC family thiol-disulfide oxidoreductase YuxK